MECLSPTVVAVRTRGDRLKGMRMSLTEIESVPVKGTLLYQCGDYGEIEVFTFVEVRGDHWVMTGKRHGRRYETSTHENNARKMTQYNSLCHRIMYYDKLRRKQRQIIDEAQMALHAFDELRSAAQIEAQKLHKQEIRTERRK